MGSGRTRSALGKRQQPVPMFSSVLPGTTEPHLLIANNTQDSAQPKGHRVTAGPVVVLLVAAGPAEVVVDGIADI